MKSLTSFGSFLGLFFFFSVFLYHSPVSNAYSLGRYVISSKRPTPVTSNLQFGRRTPLLNSKLYKIRLQAEGNDQNGVNDGAVGKEEAGLLDSVVDDDEDEANTFANQFTSEQEAVDILIKATVKSNNVDPVIVEQALLYLERLERRSRKDESSEKIDLETKMKGGWRLVFTTGTKATQKKLYWGSRIFSNKGKKIKLNYFPVKAVQYFGDDNDYRNTALYFSDKPDSKSLINVIGKYYAPSKTKMPKLELDVQKINIGGWIEVKSQGKGYFTMFYVDDKICCARGQGGGLAVWSKQE